MLLLVIRGPYCSAGAECLVVLGGKLDCITVAVALVDMVYCRILCGSIGNLITFDSVEL